MPGNKPKLTKEFISKAADLKRHGLSNQDICNGLHVSTTAFYGWLQTEQSDGTPIKKSELEVALSEALKDAETDFKDTLIERLLDHSNDTWQAGAWLLERIYPAQFGRVDRLQADVSTKGTSSIAVRHTFDYGDDEQDDAGE